MHTALKARIHHRWLTPIGPRSILWGGATLSLSLLLGAAIAAALLWRDMVADAEADVGRLVRLLAQFAIRAVEPADEALVEVRQALEREGFGRVPVEPRRLHELLRRQANAGSHVRRLSVLDARGRVLAVSDDANWNRAAEATPPRFADFGRAPRSGAPIVGAAQPSPISGEAVIPLVRAITAPGKGASLGAVVASLDVAGLQAAHERVRLADDWQLVLLHESGVPLVGGLPEDDWRPLVTSLPADLDESIRWRPAQARELLVGLRRVGHWPLVAAVGVRADGVVASWRQRALGIAAITLPAAVGAMLLAWLAARTLQRLRGVSRTLDITGKRYETLVETSPDGILLATDGVVDYANPAMLGLAGAGSLGALRGRRVGDLLEGMGALRGCGGVASSDACVRLEHRLHPLRGAARDVETLVTAQTADGDASLQIVVRDISERKAAERALRDSGERYRQMVEGASDSAFLLIDADGRVERVGMSAECPLLAAGDLQGRRLEALFTPEAAAAGVPQRLLAQAATDRRAEHEGWCPRGDGTRFRAEFVVCALDGEAAPMRGFHVQLRDVSRRHQLQQQLESVRVEVEALAMAAEAAREQEKRRIARELHDELGQVLTVQHLEVELLDAEARSRWPELRPRIEALQARIEDAMAVARRISVDLRPLVLDDLGLVAALEWLVQQARARSGIVGSLAVQGDAAQVGDDVATTLFRIAQESVTNVMRHAAARRFTVTLAIDGEALLRIADDGRGLDGGARRRGLGLRGIEERVRLIGGRTTVGSLPGGGTCVEVRLPLAALRVPAAEPRAEDVRA